MVARRLPICRSGAALRLTQAIRVLLGHLFTINAARVFTGCSVVASTSVQWRHNRGRGALLQHHGQLRSCEPMSARWAIMRFGGTSMLLFCVYVRSVLAETVTVTNTNDSGPGSLRQALTIANDGDTI